MSTSEKGLHQFLLSVLLSEDYTLHPITNSASQRKYFRLVNNSISYIVTLSNNTKENETFFYFNEKLKEAGMNVPDILHISQDRRIYIQQDLGDENLLSLIQERPANLVKILETCLKDLVKMQVVLPKSINFQKCYEFSSFNNQVVLNDLFYFKNYFLEYMEVPFQKGKLINEFFQLAEDIKALPQSFFMYRDFMSRNIMIQNQVPYYIDYQGGMKGIACYDLVSFSWQAKANFSLQEKENLKNFYFSMMLNTSSITPAQLELSYRLSLILRIFQLLGAYGFRGLVQRKPHFIESIKNTLQNVQFLVQNNYLSPYPEWESLSQNYLQISNIDI